MSDFQKIFVDNADPDQDLITNNSTYYYFKNGRGVNYLPIMHSEWEKSGYLPRHAADSYIGVAANSVSALLGYSPVYDSSNAFYGTNKTSQWWYYNHNDNDVCLRHLKSIGINCIRTFTDINVWARDPDRFNTAIKDFAKLCDKYKIRAQYVIWDGVGSFEDSLANYSLEPSSTSMTVSSLEHGLISSWQRIPHQFQVSSEQAAANYYTASAIPFLTDFVSSLSSYQSTWSVDISNEHGAKSDGLGGYTNYRAYLSFSSCEYLRTIMPNLKLTFGNGAGISIYSGTMPYGRGPGGTYAGATYDIYQLSSVLDFWSIHSYHNNRYTLLRMLDEAVSSAKITGIPVMINEFGNADSGRGLELDLSTLTAYKFGAQSFDGLSEFGMSREPFRDVQGIFYWDGQCRRSEEARQYALQALNWGWLRRVQLNLQPTQKVTSNDYGLDGGYWSGTPVVHQEFNESLYISAIQNKWEASKNIFYGIGILGGLGGPRETASIYYATIAGHPMSQSYTRIGQYEASTTQNWIEYLYTYSSLPYFSSMSDFSSIDDKVSRLQKGLGIVSRAVECLSAGTTWNELIGSQYDYNPIASSLRLEFSALYYPLGRLEDPYSGISIVANKLNGSESNFPCQATSSCYYNTLGDPSSGIDYAAYDAYYDQLIPKAIECIEAFSAAAELDDRYRLY